MQQFSYHQSGMTNKSFLLQMVVTSWFPWHHPQVKHSAIYKAWLRYWKSLVASFHGDQISRVNDLSDPQIWADERTQCLVWTNCQRHAQRKKLGSLRFIEKIKKKILQWIKLFVSKIIQCPQFPPPTPPLPPLHAAVSIP